MNIAQAKIGSNAIRLGSLLLRRAYGIKPTKTLTTSQVDYLMNNQVAMGIGKFTPDYKMNLIKWTDWLNIFETYWGNRSDVFVYATDTDNWDGIWNCDCDNFAFYFSANMAMVFGINSATTVWGDWIRGKEKIGHYYNIIIALDDNNEPAPYLYEPMNGKWSKIENKVVKIEDAEYRSKWFIFF
ncbi:MAG: hypothetical protein PHS93_09085 [Candidatus Omnitrophica bacterium]|nr:hypothetical protein [Candidatus Omnitrophota bacterium]MDD5551291.1 hypothetical protein [Candidatus Omnitrophota bacterium]